MNIRNKLIEYYEYYIYWIRKFQDPEKIISQKYELLMGKKLDLQNPTTYNEKLQWLKLHDKNPKYTTLADKYEVRKFVSDVIGEKHLIPLIGVYSSPKEINYPSLPNQFVLKCTHDSGSVYICKEKETFNTRVVNKKLSTALSRNFYYAGFEWPYMNIPPRIIAENYMIDESGYELKDYKFFCFNGEPKALFVATDRGHGTTRFDFFDINFNHLDVTQHYPRSERTIHIPDNYEKMIELARLLSKDLIHVRIDMYNVSGTIYIGEFTFYHFCGYQPFVPQSFDLLMGSWIDLSILSKKDDE